MFGSNASLEYGKDGSIKAMIKILLFIQIYNFFFLFTFFSGKETLTFICYLLIMIKPSFNLINASAGSGKTYSLVFNYIKKLLLNSNDDHFRGHLALTFTNKAVNEMKSRIIETLSEFVKKEDCEMRNIISTQINLDQKEIRNKSCTNHYFL